MAGHSQFKNIMHRKGAQDKKRAKVFTKIIRELTVAAKGNPDPASNPRLRVAIDNARSANMPKDTMERAIKRGAGDESTENYEEVRYEGFAVGGVAVIVEGLTDNRNRTASDVRTALTKYGGSLGENNSVSFMFDRVGLILYPTSVADEDKMLETVIEAGGDSFETEGDVYEILTAPDALHETLKNMENALGTPEKAILTWKPQNVTTLNLDQATTFMKMLDVLEDNDDVQNIYTNVDIPDDVMEKL